MQVDLHRALECTQVQHTVLPGAKWLVRLGGGGIASQPSPQVFKRSCFCVFPHTIVLHGSIQEAGGRRSAALLGCPPSGSGRRCFHIQHDIDILASEFPSKLPPLPTAPLCLFQQSRPVFVSTCNPLLLVHCRAHGDAAVTLPGCPRPRRCYRQSRHRMQRWCDRGAALPKAIGAGDMMHRSRFPPPRRPAARNSACGATTATLLESAMA